MKKVYRYQLETFIKSFLAGVLVELGAYFSSPEMFHSVTLTTIGFILIRQLLAVGHSFLIREKDNSF